MEQWGLDGGSPRWRDRVRTPVPGVWWELRVTVRQGVVTKMMRLRLLLAPPVVVLSLSLPSDHHVLQNPGSLGMVGMTGQLEAQRFCLGSPHKHGYFLAMGPGAGFLPGIQSPCL